MENVNAVLTEETVDYRKLLVDRLKAKGVDSSDKNLFLMKLSEEIESLAEELGEIGSTNFNFFEKADYAHDTFGALESFIFLYSNYDEHITAYGHQDYYEEGCATGRGHYDMVGEDLDAHNLMIGNIESLNLGNLVKGADDIHFLLKKFYVDVDEDQMDTETCWECRGSGSIDNDNYDPDDEDCTEDEYVDCPHCDNGEIESDNPDYGEVQNKEFLAGLDEEYKKIGEAFKSELTDYVLSVYYPESFSYSFVPDANRQPVPKYAIPSETETRYPQIKVKLTGTDGNAFSIMGNVRSALHRGKVSKEEIEKYVQDSMKSGSYEHLLGVAMKWVDVR